MRAGNLSWWVALTCFSSQLGLSLAPAVNAVFMTSQLHIPRVFQRRRRKNTPSKRSPLCILQEFAFTHVSTGYRDKSNWSHQAVATPSTPMSDLLPSPAMWSHPLRRLSSTYSLSIRYPCIRESWLAKHLCVRTLTVATAHDKCSLVYAVGSFERQLIAVRLESVNSTLPEWATSS